MNLPAGGEGDDVGPTARYAVAPVTHKASLNSRPAERTLYGESITADGSRRPQPLGASHDFHGSTRVHCSTLNPCPPRVTAQAPVRQAAKHLTDCHWTAAPTARTHSIPRRRARTSRQRNNRKTDTTEVAAGPDEYGRT